jgi:Concanavalin A-like lectin/glucanases superfamily
MKQKGKVMKQSSAILKFLVVLGILTLGLVAGAPAQGFGLQRQHRVPSPPILPPIILTNPIIQPGRPILPMPIVPPVQPTNIHPILPTNTFPPIILLPNCTRAPVGLVGWWKGDGNTLDSSGLGNSGVAINIGYTNGIVGQAFACDPNSFPYGTYTGIQIPDQPAYVLTNSLSIEGWVRPRGDGYGIFWRGDNRPGLDPYFLSMQGNNNLRFYIEDESGNSAMVGTYLTYNQWTHVAATLDGSTGTMSIYTNGVLADQTVTDVRPFGNLIPGDSPGVGIGNVNDGFNNFPFTGDIDEISLYNRALSAAEVQAIYHAGSAGKCPIVAPTCASAPSGLVGWWPAEGNGNDSAGTNNATVPDGVTYAPAEVGQGFSLDGQDHRIVVPDAPQLNFSSNQDFSIEVWIQPLANPGNWKDVMSVVDKRVAPDTITQLGYELNLEGGVVVFQMADVLAPYSWNNFSGGPDLRDGQFHHVAVTVQRNSTSGGQIYIDGQLVLTFDPTVCPGDLSNPGPLRIGNHATPGLPAFYHGIIDEVSLYNRALSSNEIVSIYNAGSAGKCPIAAPTCVPPPSGLISWWPGDGNANDIVGPNNGYLTNDISFTNGEVNLAFGMGTNGFVFIPASPSLDVGPGPGFTIEGWIYPTAISASAPNPIVEWSQDGGVYAGQQFYVSSTLLDSPGCLFAGFIESNNASAGDWFTSAANIVTNNGYQHVALTYNHATGDAAMYLNGVMVAGKHVNVSMPWTTGNVLIGHRINIETPSQNFHFAGREDEISLYNRALTAAEIQSIYNAGSAGKCAGPLPPGITVSPVNQTSVAGSNVVLSVVASGAGPFSYQWSFNGTNILGATNAMLTLTNLHPNQSGSYAATITTPYGTITSSGAIVTVIARNILVYKYSGAEKITTAGQTFAYSYSGQMFFIPDNTNGTFVGWGTIKGQKQCWVNPLSDYLLITIPGASNQTFTVLGQAGQGIDTNGCPHIWSYLHKGKNTPLTIGQKMYFSFPNTFAADATHVYPDSQTGNMVLSESSSTYTFVPQSTQTANNTGQTMTDLVNALTQSLASQGYQSQ